MSYISKFKMQILIVLLHLTAVLYFRTIIPEDAMIPRFWNL